MKKVLLTLFIALSVCSVFGKHRFRNSKGNKYSKSYKYTVSDFTVFHFTAP